MLIGALIERKSVSIIGTSHHVASPYSQLAYYAGVDRGCQALYSTPMKKTDETGLRTELRLLCEEEGHKEWAQRHDVSVQYVSDVIHNRRKPGKAIYTALGYEKRVEYVRVG